MRLLPYPCVLLLALLAACGSDPEPDPETRWEQPIQLDLRLDRSAAGGATDAGCGAVGGQLYRIDVIDEDGTSLLEAPVEVACAARFQLIDLLLVRAIDGDGQVAPRRGFVMVDLDRYTGWPLRTGQVVVERREQEFEVTGSASAPIQVDLRFGEVCDDLGVDDDADGATDCEDAECWDGCTAEDCDNGMEDDNDGRIDCDDPECAGDAACPTAEVCTGQNGDEDGDGLANCADPDCCVVPECSTSAACLVEDCAVPGDEDHDLLADCADPACAAGCGTLRVTWSLTLDAAATTCATVQGDTVLVELDGPGAFDLAASDLCSAGHLDVAVPAGAYAVSSTLRMAGPSPLASDGPDQATVTAAQLTTVAAAFALTGTSEADVVIARVYSSGGEDATSYDRDFVELFNRSAAPINLTGWSLQVRSSSSSWAVVDLIGEQIAAGGYLLVQLGRTATPVPASVDLPTPDVVGGEIDLISPVFSVVVRRTVAGVASDSCPASIEDLFGMYSAPCKEAGGYFGGPGYADAITRTDPCTDADNNGTDFQMTALGQTSQVRSSATPAQSCP